MIYVYLLLFSSNNSEGSNNHTKYQSTSVKVFGWVKIAKQEDCFKALSLRDSLLKIMNFFLRALKVLKQAL